LFVAERRDMPSIPSIAFASTCPSCKRQQPQDGFTVAVLERLLRGGYPIEAYCVICNEFWPISLKKRIELCEVVAAACRGRGNSPLNGADRLDPPSPEG